MSFIRLAPGSSRPLLPIAEFLIVGFTVFVLAGGLFVLTQGGQGLLNVASGYSFVYPGDINNQTTQDLRDDHGSHLHNITLRPHLRQDRPTLD